jgi:RNA polymerase-binding protein DksA
VLSRHSSHIGGCQPCATARLLICIKFSRFACIRLDTPTASRRRSGKRSKTTGEIVKTLTSQQRRQLEKALLSRRAEVFRSAHDELLRGEDDPYTSMAGEVSDEGDQANAMTQIDFDNEIARRHSGEIRSIDAALERMKDHSYGTCIDCDCEIVFARLAAFPTANRCVLCQEQHEKTYAHELTPSL